MKKATITWTDKTGQHQATIDTRRFTIGRSRDNNLVLNDAAISPRHALIEAFEDSFQITDCGSLTTIVNGKKITKSQILNSGDIILLGNSVQLTIAFSLKPSSIKNQTPSILPQETTLSTSKPIVNKPLIVMAALITAILGIVLLLVNIKQPVKSTKHSTSSTTDISYPTKELTQETPNTLPTNTVTPSTQATPSETITDEQMEKAAVEVMRRISSDDKPYIFPEIALRDIKARLRKYQNQNSLATSLTTLNQLAGKFALLARQEGIEPALLLYVMLAQAEGNLKSDLNNTAKTSLENLVALRATFGSGLADGSLIIVAAYRMGSGTKKSHPLLATMRKVVKNPQTDRNVWYLREKGGLSEDAYNFVLDFLALGIIAQNPKLYAIEATSLSY